MSELYVSYSAAKGFARSADKASLSGKVLSYQDFKNICADIAPGSADEYGIILAQSDVQEFIANFECDSIFSDAEK